MAYEQWKSAIRSDEAIRAKDTNPCLQDQAAADKEDHLAVSMKHSRSGAIRKALSAPLSPLTAAPYALLSLPLLLVLFLRSISPVLPVADAAIPLIPAAPWMLQDVIWQYRYMSLASVCRGLKGLVPIAFSATVKHPYSLCIIVWRQEGNGEGLQH